MSTSESAPNHASERPSAQRVPRPVEALGEVRTERERLLHLRWLSVLAMSVVALLVFPQVAPAHPRNPLFAVILALVAINLLMHAGALSGLTGRRGAMLQLIADMLAWGTFLYFGGGATNPAIAFLLPLVAVGATILSAPQAWALAALAVLEYSLLWRFHHAVQLADAHMAMTWHLAGMWLGFSFSALTVVWFVVRLNAALLRREQALAASDAARARDAYVVGVGKLAAGAAHRLGTPLGTLRILSDELARRADLGDDVREDIELMRTQVDHCRDILNGLAREAGQPRAEGGGAVSAAAWIDGVLTRWRGLRPHARAALSIPVPLHAARIVADASLAEALHNLIDNAANVNAKAGQARAPVGVKAQVSGGDFVVEVSDQGGGIPAAVCDAARKGPLAGSASGMGLGLFLAYSAVEHHGGTLGFTIGSNGGTIARLSIPLQEKPE